ncbi:MULTISPECIES: helix-turn-helix domain-containing protein [Serratia]|uniref:helix-turn-helix domain-containing protein n=1 Tax=Serratia TaxID=613 RepID=UPI001AE7C59D|nr:S24 family peptidase [Serratia sp. PL17]MBP1130488.1 phage repressor protein C with HTH and peptisase S24 domain [Serratia sp. PL17]
MKETENKEKDVTSLSGGEKRTPEVELSEKLRAPWVSAQDVAGLPDVPTTARRARDLLEKATMDRPLLKRKRKGTKATEYHASTLPIAAIRELLRLQTESKGELAHEPSSSENAPNASSNEYTFTDFLDEFALIPGYRVQVSAGHGTVGDTGTEPCRHLAFRRKWMRYRGFKEGELVVVWAKGDSMEPTISNNNTLLINTAKTRPTDGNIYVIRQEDMLWVKRIQVLLDGSWLLISDNSSYKPLEIKPDSMHNLQVIGQVVNIAKDIGD